MCKPKFRFLGRKERRRTSTTTPQQNYSSESCQLHTRRTVIRALSRHCVLRYIAARVCSVNLRLLTHTPPLFCYFYFKLFFSKTLGLVVIYDLRVLFALLYNSRLPSRPSQPANSTGAVVRPPRSPFY